MYNVVIVANWSSVVPSSWVNEENEECRWPPKKIIAASAIVKRTEPEDGWKTLRYKKLLGPFESYAIAKTIEITSINISSSDEAAFREISNNPQNSSKLPEKRPVKRAKFYDESMSDESDAPQEKTFTKVKRAMPTTYQSSAADFHSSSEFNLEVNADKENQIFHSKETTAAKQPIKHTEVHDKFLSDESNGSQEKTFTKVKMAMPTAYQSSAAADFHSYSAFNLEINMDKENQILRSTKTIASKQQVRREAGYSKRDSLPDKESHEPIENVTTPIPIGCCCKSGHDMLVSVHKMLSEMYAWHVTTDAALFKVRRAQEDQT